MKVAVNTFGGFMFNQFFLVHLIKLKKSHMISIFGNYCIKFDWLILHWSRLFIYDENPEPQMAKLYSKWDCTKANILSETV